MSKLNKTLDLLHHHGLNDPQNLQDYLQLAELSDDKERLLRAVHATYDRLRDHPSDKAYTDYIKALHFAAPYDFDSYVLFCESLRPPEEQFYLPRRKQLQTISAHLQDLAERKIRFLSISLPPRVGKAQPISSLVLTPTGYVPMGLLEVGDQVIGGAGKPTEIVAIHEQGELECVSVEMSGGGKVECCTDHLWVASNASQRKELGTYTTKEIMDTPGSWRIPWVEPIEFSPDAKKPHELPIDPYLMGVLLAQGYWGDVIELRIDDELANILTATLPEDDQLILHRYLKGNSKSRGRRAIWRIYADPISLIVPETVFLLRELGMGRSPCPLPDIYRYGSPETRRLVLAGILDASGLLLKNRESYIRLFRDSGLLEDAAFLARSLGGSASFVNEPGNNRQALFISLNDTPYPTRRPSRQRIRRERVPHKQGLGRILRSITSIGKKPCRCITVANQAGTYVTNTFAVTHNSTLCTFFLSWLMGKYPESTNAMVSYSNSICSTFDKEIRTFINTPSVYRWGEVFPGLQDTMEGSRGDLTINLGKPKRFPTLTCRGIDGTWTGAIDVSGLLYSDDLVKNRDEVLNPNRLEKLYQNYLNNVKDRMKEDEGAISLMVGTRWSVFDPIGRELEQNAGDPNYRFVTIPALNEFDESNFVYLYDQGFSTETYVSTRNSLAPDEWQAKYMGAPFVREGLLFPSDSLKYYHSLPDADPVRRMAVCDVAFGGGDYLSLVVVGDYGEDGYYLEDVVFNKGHKGITQELVIAKLLRHTPDITVFEANAGGGLYAEQVEEELKKIGVKLNIRSIPTGSQRSKKSRILQYSTDILEMNFLEAPRRSREYASFMTNLCLYTSEGRNVNDDAPDSLALFFEHAAIGGAILTPMRRPY